MWKTHGKKLIKCKMIKILGGFSTSILVYKKVTMENGVLTMNNGGIHQ